MARLGAALALGALLSAGTTTVAAGGDELACAAPEPVCAVRARVFPVASFDPVGSAVLLEPGLLVTNRHVVADHDGASLFLPDGRTVPAAVVPTAYGGDLVLLQIPESLLGAPPLELGAAAMGAPVYAVEGDAGAGAGARVHPPGEVILPPVPDRPSARLHHSAPSEPGNGGALVDQRGRLVGVIASGGDEGRNEALPAAPAIAELRRLSGLEYYIESQRLGAAYRRCVGAVEGARATGPTLGAVLAEEAVGACAATGNPQLYAMAGRLLAASGRIADALALFEAALALDPDALDARIGRVIALHLALRFEETLPELRRLVSLLPRDVEVLRLAVQAAERGGDPELARRAYALLDDARRPTEIAPRARGAAVDAAGTGWPPGSPGG